ncbi:hypothetical protein CDL12_12926 [Handroanthus impetiginosus]|uniref:Uncharacterized protein n=1 Tax=Handroanthus impetiginosus TaxID=429701 RepID=A0A2G9HAA2_9LAMI|nr:hypothetical protein CDL12_12926 [Handroanthus impetiginosus]
MLVKGVRGSPTFSCIFVFQSRPFHNSKTDTSPRYTSLKIVSRYEAGKTVLNVNHSLMLKFIRRDQAIIASKLRKQINSRNILGYEPLLAATPYISK